MVFCFVFTQARLVKIFENLMKLFFGFFTALIEPAFFLKNFHLYGA